MCYKVLCVRKLHLGQINSNSFQGLENLEELNLEGN